MKRMRLCLLFFCLTLVVGCASDGAAIAPEPTVAETPSPAPAASAPPPVPTSEPAPSPKPILPVVSPEIEQGGRVTHALVNGHWVYMREGDLSVYALPLDAPTDQEPTVLLEENGFPFFLVWKNAIYVFANPETGVPPMRGILIEVPGGERRVFDMRQSEFYYPSLVKGDYAYGAGEEGVRRINLETGETQTVREGEVLFAASARYLSTYDGYALTDGPAEWGVTLPGGTSYCALGDGLLLRAANRILYVDGDSARLLFAFEEGVTVFVDSFYEASYTPEYVVCRTEGETDALGNEWQGTFLIGRDGLVPMDEDALTDRPASHEGSAVFCEGLTDRGLVPMDDYPLCDELMRTLVAANNHARGGEQVGEAWIERAAWELEYERYVSILASGEQGQPLWARTFVEPYGNMGAFVPSFRCRDMFYVIAGNTLWALDPATGTALWSVDGVGIQNSWAFGPDDTLYICGLYGPMMMAISPDGEILWDVQAMDGETVLWYPRNVRIENDQIIVDMDTPDRDSPHTVRYEYDGTYEVELASPS